MTRLKTAVPTDTWIVATWDEYIQTIDHPAYQKAKCYYHNGKLRIEMTPLGYDHASDHTVIIFAVNLCAALKGIPLHGLDNCTYRKTGFDDAVVKLLSVPMQLHISICLETPCPKCSSQWGEVKETNNIHGVGLYCKNHGHWIKWIDNGETLKAEIKVDKRT